MQFSAMTVMLSSKDIHVHMPSDRVRKKNLQIVRKFSGVKGGKCFDYVENTLEYVDISREI